MSERAIQKGRGWTSELPAVAFYSVLILLIMLSWDYVPA
jgi:hypothetical protein